MENKQQIEIDNIEDLESLVLKRRYDIKKIFRGFDIESVDNQFIAYYDHWFYEILGKLTFCKNVRLENPGKYERGGGMCEREGDAIDIYITIDVPVKTSIYIDEYAEKIETEYKFKMTTDRAGFAEIDTACVLRLIEKLNKDE